MGTGSVDSILILSVILPLLVAVFSLAGKLRRIREQLSDMEEILKDIQQGNGNRRILLPERNIAAPLAYRMNEIVSSYEAELTEFRKIERTNKELMTSLSHDVRTPLTTLIGYLNAAHRGMVTGKEREEYIGIADRKAHDVKDYIDILFEWFKLNSDEFMLEMQKTELGELTRNILKDWIPVFEEKGIDYEIEIPARRLPVIIDQDAYLRVINNLIQNVFAHSQADKVEITLAVRGGSEDRVAVRVYDNGVGIDDADLEYVFERLYKCDKGRSGKGSGLGLSIVRQMVEKMGGTVSVRSRQGEYCEFVVEFTLEKERRLYYN